MEEKDMGDIKPEDLTGVEVQFEVELDEEFPGYCSDCSVELEPVTINVRRGRFMILDVTAYKCPVCHKEFIDIDTGIKIDRVFDLLNAEEQKGYEISIVKSGKECTIVFPEELDKKISGKIDALLFQISDTEYLLKIPAENLSLGEAPLHDLASPVRAYKKTLPKKNTHHIQ